MVGVAARSSTARHRGKAALLLSVLIPGSLAAQADPMLGIEHRFAEIGGLRLEYFEFGGAGTPIVLVQDHHDYFHGYADTSAEDELTEMIGFLQRLGERHRVIAPVRRGWGESEDAGFGYDVASQAEDVLGLLDWLGVPEAVFLGRTAATQEMTWIAEHHPGRVKALAYWGTPIGHLPDTDPGPEVARFAAMYNRRACDIGGGAAEAIDARLEPRRSWRAHFAVDERRRLQIPTLLVLHPVFDRVSMQSRRLDRIEAWAPDDFGDPEGWCDDEARAYFVALSQDAGRIDALRRTFERTNELARTHEAMRRAFGGGLTIVWEDEQPDDPVFGPLMEALEEFLSGR